MTDADHVELLQTLHGLSGMVFLSGYRSDLYDAHLDSWTRVETKARISAGRGTAVRTECLWISPGVPAAQLF